MIQPMKAVSIALFVTVVLAAPVAAHEAPSTCWRMRPSITISNRWHGGSRR